MKNKLLLTSALAGSLLISASAFAETKITGSMEASYTGTSENKGTGTTLPSGDGIGMETQINFSNSGALNVGGLKYQAGFSVEADGSMDAYEGAHIRIISGGTSVEIGQDSFQPLDGTVVPRVSLDIASMDPNATNVIKYTGQAGDDVTEQMGFGIAQDIGVGKIGVFYSPKDLTAANGGGNDGFVNDATDSGYEVNFKGDLGVKGLTVLLGKSDRGGGYVANTATQDQEGTMFGAAYNFGKIAIGVSKQKQDFTTVGSDIDTQEIGATFAVSDNFSIGATYAETEVTNANVKAAADEEIYLISAGYNLGAITMSVSYQDVENASGVSGTDVEFFNVRLLTKF